MPEIHSIRLHGPWQASVLESFSPKVELVPEHRAKIPSDWCNWLGTSFCGRVAYVRNFGLPTGLTAEQKVWLVVEEIDFCGDVILNDRSLGRLQLGDSPMKIDVHQDLQKSNRLRIEVELPHDVDRGDRKGLAGGLIGGVRLEIESSNQAN